MRKFLRIKNNLYVLFFLQQFSKCISISSSSKDSHRNHPDRRNLYNDNHDFDDSNFGELIPKTLALSNADKFALKIAPLIKSLLYYSSYKNTKLYSWLYFKDGRSRL